MKNALVALSALAIASSANAYMFAPKHGAFALNGTVEIDANQICTMNAAGTTHGERAIITAITMSSQTYHFCNSMTPVHLPWKIEMSDDGQPIIRHMRFYVPYLGYSHDRDQAASVDHKGNWTFIPSGEIQLSGTVASTPPIDVKP